MTNHGHFTIDANGTDISKIMHGINLSYATYFNYTHKCHGHLSQIGLELIDGDRRYKNIMEEFVRDSAA